MKRLRTHFRELLPLVMGIMIAACAPARLEAQAPPAASAQFDLYVQTVEARLARQHRSITEFLARPAAGRSAGAAAIAGNGPEIEHIAVPGGAEIAGAMIHHWRATGFVPGATAADFERLLRDVPAYPRLFAPRVTRAAVVQGGGDRVETTMRMREQHVLTVWMDVGYDVQFGRLDAAHRFAVSRSTQVRELADVGTRGERALSESEEHGWLWRMNTYWSYEERDGGLYLQVESVSLTRAVPRGLGWVVGPYVQSIPRESLAWTLQAVCRAIQK